MSANRFIIIASYVDSHANGTLIMSSMQENAVLFRQSFLRFFGAPPLNGGGVTRSIEAIPSGAHRDVCGTNGFRVSSLEFWTTISSRV